MDRIDVCSVWTSFGRYFYKSVPKMTTGCKKPEFSKPHYNAVFGSLPQKAKTLSGSSNPVGGTTGSRPFFRLGRSLRRFFCASMSGETSKALAPVTGSAGVHSAGSRPFFRGHSPVFPSVTSVIDGIFLPRSRYSLLFVTVPAPCYP